MELVLLTHKNAILMTIKKKKNPEKKGSYNSASEAAPRRLG